MGGKAVKITADTNVLLRAVLEDDERQSAVARSVLEGAESVVLTLTALCELVWVLSQGYKIPNAEIAATVRALVDASNVVANRPAIESGLALLDAGGDFADGIVAHEGITLGADIFVSFDVKAVKLIKAREGSAKLLG